MDDPGVIAKVLAALSSHAQGSSRICFDRNKEDWVQVRTLSRDVTSVWNERPREVENISIAATRRVMRQRLCQFKRARVESDMCVSCVDLKQKVLPPAKRLVKGSETSWKNSCLGILQDLTITLQPQRGRSPAVWSFGRSVIALKKRQSAASMPKAPRRRFSMRPCSLEATRTRLAFILSRRRPVSSFSGNVQTLGLGWIYFPSFSQRTPEAYFVEAAGRTAGGAPYCSQ